MGGPSGGFIVVNPRVPCSYQPRSSSATYAAGRREYEVEGVAYFSEDYGFREGDRLRIVTPQTGAVRVLEVVGVVDTLLMGSVVAVRCREVPKIGW